MTRRSAIVLAGILVLLIALGWHEVNRPFDASVATTPIVTPPATTPPVSTPPVSTPPVSTPPVTTPAGKPAQKNPEIREDPAVFEFKRGVSYSERKNWEVAIVYYTEAIRLNPRYAAAWLNRGIAHREKGEVDKAIRDFTGAIRWRPGFADAFYNRGVAYQKQGDQAKADADFAKAQQGDQAKADADFAKAQEFKGILAEPIVVSPAKTISVGPVPIQAIRVLDKDSVLVVTAHVGNHVGNIDAARDKKAPDGVQRSSAQLHFEWSKWALSTGQQLHRVTKESPFPVHGTMISPDGSWIGVYGGSIDRKKNTAGTGVVAIWNTNSGQEIATWKIKGASPYEVAVSPSGKRIALAAAKRLVADGEEVFEDEFEELGSSIQIWNVREGRREETLLTQRRTLVTSLSFDHNGGHLCAAIAVFDAFDEPFALSGIVWRTRDWTKTVRMEFSEGFWFPTVHPYESQIIVCYPGFLGIGTMDLWNLQSGRKTRTYEFKEKPARPVGFSPDGKQFAFKNSTPFTFNLFGRSSGSNKIKGIAVIDIESGSIVARLREPKHDTTAFSFTTDGRQIISGSSDGGIRIWKLPSSR